MSSWGDMNKQLQNPGREPIADKSKDTNQVQISKPTSFTEFIYKMWARGDILKQERLRDSCITKAHLSLADSSQKLETRSWLSGLKAAEQVGERPFQVAQLVWASSRKLDWCLLFQAAWLL